MSFSAHNKNTNICVEKKLLKIISAIKWMHFDDTDYEYELELTKLVSQKFSELDAKELEIILTSKCKNMDRKNKLMAYSAFFALIIYYRHQYDYSNLKKTWDNFNKYFPKDQFPSVNHVNILYYLYFINKDVSEEEHYLKLAEENIEKLKHVGAQHALASVFASICENYESDNEDDINRLKELKNDWFDKAMDAVKEAIKEKSDSAIFYYTRGRINSIFGSTTEAERDFATAIVKEIPTRSDYSLRLAKYQNAQILNRSRKLVHNIQLKVDKTNEKISDFNDEIRKSRNSNIETIGIFTGIVAFIIGTLQLTTQNNAFETGFNILTLMGCLTGALAAFSLLLHLGDDKEKKKVHILVIIASLLLAVGSIFAAKYWGSGNELNNSSERSDSRDNNESDSDSISVGWRDKNV